MSTLNEAGWRALNPAGPVDASSASVLDASVLSTIPASKLSTIDQSKLNLLMPVALVGPWSGRRCGLPRRLYPLSALDRTWVR